MAASKLVLLSLFAALILSSVKADVAIETDGNEPADRVIKSDGVDTSAFKVELDQLKSKIHALESQIGEKTRELKSKDDLIAQKEKVLQEKLDVVALLESEIASIQKKGNLDAAEQVGKAHAKAKELEKQVEKLKKDLETQRKEKESLENRAIVAEKRISELNLKLEKLHKNNDEQKSTIRKTERALKIAEEEMMKAKFDATSKTQQLMEVHGAWLPPWLADHLIRCKALVLTHWNEHGKPAMELAVQKALEKKAQAEKWAEPHIETVKTKLVPAVKDQYLVVVANVKPHVDTLTAKTIEAYEVSKTTITPHVIKAQEFIDPYYQQAKKLSKPYIDQVATLTKPHVDKVRMVTKPYTKKAVNAYGKFLESATTYHHQVQGTVRDMLKKHELTKPLATKELIWFLASALLALPVIILSRACSAICCKKAKKRPRNSHSHHSRRKAKRGHPDKEFR